MAECGYLIGGDPARPCVVGAGHRDQHRDAAYREREYERHRRYYRENRDRHLTQKREAYHALDRKERKLRQAKAYTAKLRRDYGLGSDEYAQIKRVQGGRCAICGIATGRSKRLSVDHCHKTREVRGILCSVCNSFLGTIRDNPEAGERLAEYLRNPPAREALGRIHLVPENSPAQQPRKRRPHARKTT